MGKKTGKSLMKAAIKTSIQQNSPQSSQYNSDDNDASSIASDLSEATYLSLDSDEEAIMEHYKDESGSEAALITAVELLAESRATTREDALEMLIRLLRYNYLLDEVESRRETLFKHIKRCLAKGLSNKEKVLAAKAMSLLAITLDPEDEEIDSDKTEVRAAYLYSLAMICFVSGVDKHDLISLSHQYIDLLDEEDTPPSVLEAVLCSLGLLISGLKMRGESEEVRRLFIKCIDVHFDLLDYPEASVRIAAGENVAVCYEIMASAKLDPGYRYLNDLVSKKMNMLLHDRSRFRGLHIHMAKNDLMSNVFGDSMFGGSLGSDPPRVVNSDNSAISKARSQAKAASRNSRREYLEENAGGEILDDLQAS
ncbi:Interferon- developmental regulator 2 [Massospora cicadina]|nr:Interferon- developmental regulator 2 [Massospora cicadina]